tara:strand:+ start:302 stop:586 length:285 start_codon:yes stop_codon:yes gene_type:complete
MSYQPETYHIPSPSQILSHLFLRSQNPAARPGFIYVKQQPQNTRKQNGNYGISISDPEDAWAKLICFKKSEETRTSFSEIPAWRPRLTGLIYII